MSYSHALTPLVLLILPMMTFSQSPTPQRAMPAVPAPASCSIPLMSAAPIVGGIPYKRLAIQLEALRSAQNAVSAMEESLEDFKAQSSLSLAMSALFTGTKKAHDDLLCSAAIIAHYKPADKDDANARALQIDAYNQEAAAISELEAHSKKKFLLSAKEQTPEAILKDAEEMTAIQGRQQGAAETLIQTTTYALMVTVDLSHPDTKDTTQTVLSCDEFEALKVQSTAFAKESKSAYTDVASLITSFLEGHRCK